MNSFGKYISEGFNIITGGLFRDDDKENEAMGKNSSTKSKKRSARKGVNTHEYYIVEEVLDKMRTNVGKFPAETGGMIGSTDDKKKIDLFYFDEDSANSFGTFYYNIEKVSKVNNEWKDNGYRPTGFVHSHPNGMVVPSFHDVATAKLHMDFWKHDFFTMPIVQSKKNGLFEIYLYVAYQEERVVRVKRTVVIRATEDGYDYDYSKQWERVYSNINLDRENGVDNIKVVNDKHRVYEPGYTKKDNKNYSKETSTVSIYNESDLFSKIPLPETVKNKVIVCVGCGGAREYLEGLVRHGFRYFLLMDGDVVSASNVATQKVYVSEIGKKKVDMIKREILDINPAAIVITVDKFLDENMSDEEFMGYLHSFKVRNNKDYLLLGCTDNFDAQSRTAHLALKYGMMYEAAMLFKNGVGAEIIFTYPGVTACCPRCLLRKRFEDYENGFKNDVDSSNCTYFATSVMNAYKGFISLMLLMYHDAPGNNYNDYLDQVKDRNYVEIRLSPDIKDVLGIGLFDKAFEGAKKYTFMGENLWVPQFPDNEENGVDNCKMCGGTGNLNDSYMKWRDTREVAYGYKKNNGFKVADVKLRDLSKVRNSGTCFDVSV